MLASSRLRGIEAILLVGVMASACNKGYQLTTSGSSGSDSATNSGTGTNGNPSNPNNNQPSPGPSQSPTNQIPTVAATSPDDCSNTNGAAGTSCPIYFTLSFATTHTISFEWILSSTTPTGQPPAGEVWGVPGTDYEVGSLQTVTFAPDASKETGTWINISSAGKKFRAEYNVSNCKVDGQVVNCSELGFN